ncbi:hypothetical protein [Streptomyces tagetis]|uniref:Uncharacterized protein n=1 Tax=Streptomyces tagetis TaxID=2820809 RepID=A0A940XM09_9ACTN|nr:hypothetical protein [Streptomyces sp. RG38]MBQ0827210.1 hypothetical protein [Streptomyces sp. RG38]
MRQEYEALPARWLMVPAGLEIELDPPGGACRRCGGPRPAPAASPPPPRGGTPGRPPGRAVPVREPAAPEGRR